MSKRIKVISGIAAGAVVVAAVAFFIVDTRAFQTTTADRLPNEYDQAIPQVVSSVDYDADGIDDQADILQGALDYIATQPKYKSKYYPETGYPDDGFGVCTDVVAAALLSAGYDLKELVAADIAAHPERYAIDAPDAAIDFRRVGNLRTFLDGNAIKLSTDLSALDQWQGGDIAVFRDHIAIVSDRRNAHGVPYLIHLNDPFQRTYEEDVLESRTDLTEHYRISE